MILGMSTALYTQIHVAISLIGIAAGLLVAFGMIAGNPLPKLTALFLITTILTSVTGFFFPWKGFTPGINIGILSLVVLLFTLIALYTKHLAGGWRRTYVITAMIALFLNFFVLIHQSFEKIPALKTLPPSAALGTVLVSLLVFIVLTVLADKKFRPALGV